MTKSAKPTPDELRIDFKLAFKALTDHTPLRWQTRLFNLMLSGEIRRVCDLPTGLGKTSVIVIWLIALCQQALDGRITLPRRLVYIVNRRTVVDQATTVVEAIRNRLCKPDGPGWLKHSDMLTDLDSALRTMYRDDVPLAVSTLRGELADNEEWKTEPARAAIIVGTIDMIGSKLVFSGYGDGRYKRPQHAGLIGQDSLVIHDEAHLTPAFSDLLRNVRKYQISDHEFRPIQIMELSATQRQGAVEGDVFQLEDEDRNDDIVTERLDAKKLMWLHKSDKKAQNPDLADLAYKHEDSRAKVLVYVRSPEDAVKIASDLEKRIKDKSGERVALLTGTIRGFERDRLVAKDAVYQQMLNPQSKPSETVYLVSTSAGEIGIDIDADQMVCDLVPLDSMIQRLGRVNRRGGHQREAQVDVLRIEEQVTRRPSEFEKAAAKTLEILRRWEEGSDGPLNVSPRDVRDMIDSLSSEDRADAFSPKPEIREVTDILLDAWSLTSVDDMPGRPEVAPYLHGDVPDLPETYVAWRREISLFDEHNSDDDTVSEWFRICPIRSSERVREQPDKVKAFLRRLLNDHRKKDESIDFPVVMQNNHGRTERLPLSEILGSNDRQLLNYKTLILPVEVGGLSEQGYLIQKTLTLLGI